MVAMAVFAALAFSFYVFFVPFVGSTVVKYHVIVVFSPVVRFLLSLIPSVIAHHDYLLTLVVYKVSIVHNPSVVASPFAQCSC